MSIKYEPSDLSSYLVLLQNCPVSGVIAKLPMRDISRVVTDWDDFQIALGGSPTGATQLSMIGAVAAARSIGEDENPEQYATPGDHCGKCPARTYCSARQDYLTNKFNNE